MKKALQFSAAVILGTAVLFTSCQKEELNDFDQSKDQHPQLYKDDPVYCGDPKTASFVEYEGDFEFGTLTIGNDEELLYVTFTATEGYGFNSTYLYVGPPNSDVAPVLNPDGSGEFEPSAFPIRDWQPATPSRTYTFDLSELDDTFIVIGHSKIYDELGQFYYIWSKGTVMTKAATPGYYVEYTKQVCAPPPPLGNPKLSFAYDGFSSICFKDLKRWTATYNPSGTGTWKNFMLWGWRNGSYSPGNYTFDLWAGSQGCDPENGMLVGEVTLDYDGSTATVTFEVDPVYNLSSTYVYAGHKRLPKKWGRYQVVPLLYPKKHFQVNSSEDSFTVNNLSGDIYFIASAVVKDAD